MTKSLMSDRRILEEKTKGLVVIEPFDKRHLDSAAYDITLGPWYFRESKTGTVLNPWSKIDTGLMWGEPLLAKRFADEFYGWKKDAPNGLKPDDLVIVLGPGEIILAHTNEFIGGRSVITTMMKARSSVGRFAIEICKCAGWGDVGYTNRWTLEITNQSRFHPLCLPVGRRVGQVAFFEVDKPLQKEYFVAGKYQTYDNIEDLMANWKPEDMLPKLYKDFEVTER